MKNLIIEIGDVKIRTDLLLLGDIEAMYIKKSEIDHARKEEKYDRATGIYQDYLETLYPDIENKYREYALIYNIVASEGKSNYKLQSECEHCKKKVGGMLSIELNHDYPTLKVGHGITIEFDFVSDLDFSVDNILTSIRGILIRGNYFKWNTLSDKTQEIIFSYIDESEYENILNNIQMCRAVIKGHNKPCCDKGGTFIGSTNIFGGFRIFDILVNSKNLSILYQTNHQLLSRGISLTDQMLMKPFERNIYVNMIIQKEKKEREQYENEGISRH